MDKSCLFTDSLKKALKTKIVPSSGKETTQTLIFDLVYKNSPKNPVSNIGPALRGSPPDS